MLSDSNRFLLRELIVAVGGLLLAGLFSQTTLYPRLAWWLDDALQRRFAVALPMDRVVVVDVDEASMQRLQPQLGAWPYPRDVYAKAHRFLASSGAAAVAERASATSRDPTWMALHVLLPRVVGAMPTTVTQIGLIQSRFL